MLDVSYSGTELEIGFNVSYVLDVLNALKCENVRLLLTDSVSSVQIEDVASPAAAYVVMPMRLLKYRLAYLPFWCSPPVTYQYAPGLRWPWPDACAANRIVNVRQPLWLD